MSNKAPQFDGRNIQSYNVDDFYDDMNFYWHLKNTPITQRTAFFDAAIQNPAKRPFIAKREADNFAVRDRADADNANDNARLAYHILEINGRLVWLRAQYQNDAQRELIMTSLQSEMQSPQETPQEFFYRIEDGLHRANFPEEARDFTLKQMFLNGLQRDVSQHIRSLPINTLADLLLAANNYWVAHHGYNYRPQEREQQQAPRALPQRILAKPEPPRLPLYQQAPPQIADPTMDALADQIAKLTAHVVNLQKTYEGTGPPVQKFYRQSRRSQLDDRDEERIHSNPPLLKGCAIKMSSAIDAKNLAIMPVNAAQRCLDLPSPKSSKEALAKAKPMQSR